jgi:gas vesicle protein
MTEDPRQSAAPGLVAGFLIGAAVGALTALLYAPKPGEETREELADAMQARLADLRTRLEQLKRDMAAATEAAKSGFHEGAARMRRQLDVE